MKKDKVDLTLLDAMFCERNDPGTLISIVGFDGSGKTTQISALARKFRDSGRQVIETYQPTEWYRSESAVRHFHQKGGSKERARILALCAAADRLRHVQEVINPALRDGAVVICDRYVYATFGVFIHRGIDFQFLATINSGIPIPDHSFYLEVPTSTLLNRLRDGDGDRLKFEERSADRIDSIVRVYQEMVGHLVVIDGSASCDDVTEAMWSHIISNPPTYQTLTSFRP